MKELKFFGYGWSFREKLSWVRLPFFTYSRVDRVMVVELFGFDVYTAVGNCRTIFGFYYEASE